MRSILSASVLCLLASVGLAQETNRAILLPPPNINPQACDTITAPPTISQCMACFQSQLAECDRNNQDPARRQACYTGANNLLNWCLGRIPTTPPAPQPQPRPRGAMNRGEGFAFTVTFTGPIDLASIVVFVRDIDGDDFRQQEVKTAMIRNEDGSIDIFFDDHNLGLEDDQTVGVITAVRLNGVLVSAHAEAYQIVDPLDLNQDGVVNTFDCVEAWSRYSSGAMSYEVFTNFMTVFKSR